MEINKFYRGQVFFANLGEKPEGKTDCEQYGIRPVIIIQNDIGNKYSPTVIVASITSQRGKSKLPTHVNLDWKYIGLDKESMVMLEQIRTLDKRKLLSYVGKIGSEDKKNLDKAIKVSLEVQEEEINIKVEKINDIDNIFRMGVQANSINDEFAAMLQEERGSLIKDLENYCKLKGLNAMDFLLNNRKAC